MIRNRILKVTAQYLLWLLKYLKFFLITTQSFECLRNLSYIETSHTYLQKK